MLIHSIPGKLVVTWHPQARAIIDTWENYTVTLDEFKGAVLGAGLTFAKLNKAIAWIVDSSKAKGVFSQEIQQCIGSTVFPAFTKNGIKYFITILPQSALTKLTVKNFQQQTGPNGLELVETGSVEDAVAFLRDKT